MQSQKVQKEKSHSPSFWYRFIPTLAAVLVATILVTWQVQSALRSGKEASTLQSLARESAPFQRLVQNRSQELRNELALWASRKESGLALDSDNFDAIAWIDSTGHLQWTQNGRGHFEKKWLNGISFEKLRDGEAYFLKRSEEGGVSGFAMLTSAQLADPTTSEDSAKVYLLGVLSTNALSNLVDDWVGSSRAALIFDDKGYVLASTSRHLVGTSLKDEAMVQAALNKQNKFVSGKFTDIDGHSSASYSQVVGQTNLHLALEVENHWIAEAVSQSVQECFWLSLLFFSICALLMQIFWRRSHLLRAPVLQVEESAAAPVFAETPPSLQEPAREQKQIEVPPLNFELIEQKAKHNVQEILERSAQIRARLNLELVEEAEKWVAHDKAIEEASQNSDLESDSDLVERTKPKMKVRRPQVTL